MKTFEQYNESLRDKMTPKPSYEIDSILEDNFNKLKELMQELFLKERWDDIETYIGWKYSDIEGLFLEGWSVEEVYDEYKHKISNYLDDLDDEKEDTIDFYSY